MFRREWPIGALSGARQPLTEESSMMRNAPSQNEAGEAGEGRKVWIEALRRMIAAGTYRVSAETLADCLMRRMQAI